MLPVLGAAVLFSNPRPGFLPVGARGRDATQHVHFLTGLALHSANHSDDKVSSKPEPFSMERKKKKNIIMRVMAMIRRRRR